MTGFIIGTIMGVLGALVNLSPVERVGIDYATLNGKPYGAVAYCVEWDGSIHIGNPVPLSMECVSDMWISVEDEWA